MKKFYCKKEDTIEKTPIILERRNTVSRQDGKEEVENRLSTRTNSLGNVDQLREASLLPRIQSREVTKSLSEDVLNRSYMKNPGNVITERELAASRLYKTRKASINARDSPKQVHHRDDFATGNLKDPKLKPVSNTPRDHHHKRTASSCLFPQPLTQKNDLSPVTLQDPNLKPIPVAPRDRRKGESSCLCYLGIFAAISLCTIGVLVAVTGVLYSEIFSDTNSTAHLLEQSMIDLTNLIQNNSSIHEYHVLNNKTSDRKVSSESADFDSAEIRRSGSNVIESEDIIDSVHFRQMDMTDLNRLLDDKKAEIKFQDRDTTIFEVNTSSSAEQEDRIDNTEVVKEETNGKILLSRTGSPSILNIEHVSDDSGIISKMERDETEIISIFNEEEQRENGGAITNIKQENSYPTPDIELTRALHVFDHIQENGVPKFDSKKEEISGSQTLKILKEEIDGINVMKNENIENDESRGINQEDFEVFDKKTEVDEENTKHIEGLLNPQFEESKDSSDEDLNLDLSLSDEKSRDGPRDDHLSSSVPGPKLENQSVTLTENAKLPDKNISDPTAKLSHINVEFQTKTVLLPKDKVIWKVADSIKVSNVDNESELVDEEISSENLDENASSKIEHDVETILEVVNEPGDNVQDPFTVNRNGDIQAPKTSGVGLKHDSNFFKVKSEDKKAGPMRTNSQSPKIDQKANETLRVKPLNLKASLSDAMKHLQTLDVNNKLLTSRMKSLKPKAQREVPPQLLSNKQRKKENKNMDRMQYLHNLRLALQGNLIGM